MVQAHPLGLEQPVRVLIVEDNEADAHWTLMVLNQLPIQCEVTVLTDGEQAINFILQREPYRGVPKPDITFLDINLPKFTGVQVLDAIGFAGAESICIVSGSLLEQRLMREHFHLKAQCYIVKPIDQQRLLDAFECFDHLKPIVKRLRPASQG